LYLSGSEVPLITPSGGVPIVELGSLNMGFGRLKNSSEEPSVYPFWKALPLPHQKMSVARSQHRSENRHDSFGFRNGPRSAAFSSDLS